MRSLLAVMVTGLAVSIASAQGYLTSIGYNDLQTRLGIANTPNGLNVPVAQVEAYDGTAYSANPSLASGRPGFTMTFNGTSVDPGVYSGHANGVAGNFWANGSMATGVTQVDSWDAVTWINTIINGNGSGLPPSTYLPKVSNHSYIATLSPPGTPNGFFEADAVALTRQSDYLVHRTGHIMVVGAANNGSYTPAALFGNGYNSIAVGRSDGGGGGGFTTLAGSGRVKPDLVAPSGSVSGATPIVASAATLLVQTAGATPDAARPQTIKAILMTGTTKTNFAGQGGWNHSPTVPLDSRFGAGQVNIDRAHLIMTAGQQEPSASATVSNIGWDFNTINTGGGMASRTYFFDVVPQQNDVSFTATVTWHREFVEGDSANFTFADLNMRLYAADTNFQLLGSPLEESVSAIDNVEHLYRATAMPAGRYAIVIEANGVALTDYAVAWHFIPVPEPGVILAVSVTGMVVVRRVRFKRPL